MNATEQTMEAAEIATVGGKKKKVERMGNIYVYTLDEIHEKPGFNERDYNDPEIIATIESYAARILANGLSLPLLCRRERGGPDAGKLFVVDGHLRRRALVLLRDQGHEVARIPVIITTMNDVMIMAEQINSQGRIKTPFETARVIKRMFNLGATVEMAAEILGKPKTYVTYYLKLLEIPQQIQNQIGEGKVGVAPALELITLLGEEAAVSRIETLWNERNGSAETPVAQTSTDQAAPTTAPRSTRLTRTAILGVRGNLTQVRKILDGWKPVVATTTDTMVEIPVTELKALLVAAGVIEGEPKAVTKVHVPMGEPRRRGRPAGSKNKPKDLVTDAAKIWTPDMVKSCDQQDNTKDTTKKVKAVA